MCPAFRLLESGAARFPTREAALFGFGTLGRAFGVAHTPQHSRDEGEHFALPAHGAFLVQADSVKADGRRSDAKFSGDLFGGSPGDEKIEHFTLALAEPMRVAKYWKQVGARTKIVLRMIGCHRLFRSAMCEADSACVGCVYGPLCPHD